MNSHRIRAVLLASDNLLSIWSTFGPKHDVLAMPQEDATAALEMIRRHQPMMVVMEEVFAFSAAAAALVTRLQTDPDFRGIEIRVLAGEGAAALNSPHVAHKDAQVLLATLAKPLPPRAARVRPTGEVEILINGNPATLLNLSASGIKVSSSSILRPQQQVRMSFPVASGPIRTYGVVVWSAFQLAPTPTYLAGIKLMTPLPLAMDDMLLHMTPR